MKIFALILILTISVSGFATDIALSGFRAEALMEISEYAKPDSHIDVDSKHTILSNVYCEKIARDSRRFQCTFMYIAGNQERKATLVDELAEKFRQLLLEGSATELQPDNWMRVIRIQKVDCKRIPRPTDILDINYDPQTRCVFTR